MRRAGAALVAVAALAASATGCGSDDSPSSTVVQQPTTAVAPATGPEATVPTTTTATPPRQTTTTGPGMSTDTSPTATTGLPPGGVDPGKKGEQKPGGGGDEEPARVPVTLTTAGAALSPTIVTIPAFLEIELRVTAKGGAEKLTISAPGGGTIAVPAGKTITKRLTGLKPGDYAVTTASGGKSTLRVINGGDPGP